MKTNHKAHALLIVLALTMTACQPTFRAASTTDIDLKRERQDGKVCIKETKTKVNNCHQHKADKSCNRPGDTLIWTWRPNSETSPFQIVAKPDNTSPFLPDAACTDAATTVTCTIDPDTEEDIFFYDVIVNPGAANECPYDPRILIN